MVMRRLWQVSCIWSPFERRISLRPDPRVNRPGPGETEGASFISKPFTAGELLRQVRMAMEKGRS